MGERKSEWVPMSLDSERSKADGYTAIPNYDLVAAAEQFYAMAEEAEKMGGAPNGVSFMECDTCRAKPGGPPLCAGCLHNRRVIEIAKEGAALTGDEQDAIRRAAKREKARGNFGTEAALLAIIDRLTGGEP